MAPPNDGEPDPSLQSQDGAIRYRGNSATAPISPGIVSGTIWASYGTLATREAVTPRSAADGFLKRVRKDSNPYPSRP